MNLTWLRPGQVGGSEEHLTRLLTGFVDDPDFDLTLYVLESFALAHPELAGAFRMVVAPVAGTNRLRRVVAEQRWLVSHMNHDEIDVAFHAGGTMPLRPGPAPVLLVHDVQYLTYPQNFGTVKLTYLRAQVPRSVRRASVVVVPSAYVADRLAEVFDTDRSKMRVVPHGVGAVSDPAVPFEVERPVILYPAITYPHKNHVTLVRAMAEMQHEATLVLTGGEAECEELVMDEVGRLGLTGSVRRLGRVPVEELERWWATASVLACPSLYEGFGAPLLEAMVRAVPIVASDAAAIPEVVGDAAVLVGGTDPSEWAAGLDSVLEGARPELAGLGLKQAENFTPSVAVDRLRDALADAHRRAG
ncbi:MAG: glycosyltransferase family 4 protein [Actinomycetia bacterium]|nr:glycosyltransferase family 4 protein [Actinomycetes bacterium]